MAQVVHNGRWTAEIDEPFVVFLIGMRINRWWAVHKWVPVAMAMGPMLQRLLTDRTQGLLGLRSFIGWREIMFVQYWESFEHLERYARAREEKHVPAWRSYNQRVGSKGSVGVWHETYLVEPGRVETVYDNMPRVGLPAVFDHVPATGGRETARRRIGGENQPAMPAPAEGH